LWRAAKEGGFSFEAIQIVTDEPCVPWELMRLSDRARAPDVAPEFLAIRHSVGRWLAGESSAMPQTIRVHKLAVAASDYALTTGINPLPWAAKERDLLVDTYHAQAVALKSSPMLAFLECSNVQAAHFACHGKMSINDPDASLLVMEDSPANLKPKHVARREVCEGLGSQRPLIFLNACEVGGTAAALSLVAGFPAAFLYAGAAALVSPLWAVNDAHAHRIAEDFYRQVFQAGASKPLGAVLRDLRARWKEEAHLTFLAYVLYGDPLAHVSYEPGA
jgi:CHAT domain-containing protein